MLFFAHKSYALEEVRLENVEEPQIIYSKKPESIKGKLFIENIEEALQPFFTSKEDDERSGMGFTIMESFMDRLTVRSKVGKGTTVTMKKTIKE